MTQGNHQFGSVWSRPRELTRDATTSSHDTALQERSGANWAASRTRALQLTARSCTYEQDERAQNQVRPTRRRRETLAGIPLFKDIDEGSIAHLDTQCIWRTVKTQQWVIDYQQEGTDVFFVPYGHVRVIIQSPSGRDIILRDIRDGEYFGELAAIDGRARSAGIRAVTDTVIAQMPARVFRSAIHQHPRVSDGLLLLLTSEVRRLAHRLKERDVLNGRERLFAELLRLSASCGENAARISPPPTHVELAARVGVRREVVTRELKVLERQNLIEKRRGALVILNVDYLKNLIHESE